MTSTELVKTGRTEMCLKHRTITTYSIISWQKKMSCEVFDFVMFVYSYHCKENLILYSPLQKLLLFIWFHKQLNHPFLFLSISKLWKIKHFLLLVLNWEGTFSRVLYVLVFDCHSDLEGGPARWGAAMF